MGDFSGRSSNDQRQRRLLWYSGFGMVVLVVMSLMAQAGPEAGGGSAAAETAQPIAVTPRSGGHG